MPTRAATLNTSKTNGVALNAANRALNLLRHLSFINGGRDLAPASGYESWQHDYGREPAGQCLSQKSKRHSRAVCERRELIALQGPGLVNTLMRYRVNLRAERLLLIAINEWLST
jgi:hypothetical protein